MTDNEYYKNKIIEMAKELEKIRLEIYQKADKDSDKDFFEHTNNLLFKAQSELSYTIADAVSMLDFIEE